MNRFTNKPPLPPVAMIGQKPPSRCPHPSMMPMLFKWIDTPAGRVLACIEATCLGCGATAKFDPKPAEQPPAPPNVKAEQ